MSHDRRSVATCCLAASLWLLVAPPSTRAVAAERCPPPPSSAMQPSSNATETAGLPAAEQILACVGSQAITGTTFRHWLTVAKADSAEGPHHHEPSTSDLINQVMGFLISADWVIGEAGAQHVRVSPRVVRHKFDSLRREQFPRRSEFKSFLRHTQQTIPDLLLRVELNLLAQRIQHKVIAGVHGARRQQQALTRFITSFKVKWTAQTYCLPQYKSLDCGHVQAVL